MIDPGKKSSFHVEKPSSIGFFNSSPTNLNPNYGEILTEVDLPYDPLQNPILAIVYLLSKTVILVLGEYVLIQILKFLKHETSLVNDVLKAFLYVHMAYWPVKVIFETTTDFMYPLGAMIGEWYCHFGFLWLVYGITFIVFHSFIVGLMRYVFVVHNRKTLNFGIDKAKNLFYWIAILVPLVVTVWAFFGRREISSVDTLNKCYGNHVKAFLTNGKGL